MSSNVSDCPEMHMERHAVTRSQRVFAIGKNFNVAEMFPEQSAQARAGKKVFMVAFQQMPGHHSPSMHVRKHFHVGNREEDAAPGYARDFTYKNLRLLHVLEHFDTNRAIPFAVGARQVARFKMYSAKGQLASLQNITAMGICFQSEPNMPGGH
jgi:hypothetical protein